MSWWVLEGPVFFGKSSIFKFGIPGPNVFPEVSRIKSLQYASGRKSSGGQSWLREERLNSVKEGRREDGCVRETEEDVTEGE